MRNLNSEHQDTPTRKYAYNFDYMMHDYIIRHFSHLISKKRSALELGCYKGEFTKKISTKFKKITAIEGSSTLAKAIESLSLENVEIIHSTFEDALINDKYDVIFLIHTLEHIDNRSELLKRVSSWLKPNGSFIIVVPNANAASRQIAVKMGIIDYNHSVTKAEHEHGHRITYSLDTLKEEALNSGLTLVDSGGLIFKPLANFQLDSALDKNIITAEYIEGCYKLGLKYPDLCSSIYIVCKR